MNRMLILQNPFLNPFGWMYHGFNPADNNPNAFDGVLVKYLVDKNNAEYQKYYDNLTPQEKVKEFYKNGGKGVNFDKAA